MPKKSREPFPCPVCGEDVPGGAKSCPECGACEKSGWHADAASDGLDLPEEDFDYDKFVDAEFGGGAKSSGPHKLWIIVAALLLALFVWPFFGGCFHH